MLLPSPSNDYQAPSQDARLNAAFWNEALTSVGARLRALEAVEADFQTLINAGTTQALAMISENVAPLLAQLSADAAELQRTVSLILAGGVPANNVAESDTRVFVNPAQRTAIATNTAAITAETAARGAALLAFKSLVFVDVGIAATALPGKSYRMTAGVTLSLPAAPVAGDAVRIVDGEIIGTGAAPVIGRNGKTIMGLAEDLMLNLAGCDVTLIYSGADWRLF